MNRRKVLNILKKYCRHIFGFNKQTKLRYPDIKDIVEHIYHEYMTYSKILILQNKITALSNGEIMAWNDDCWHNDFAENLKSAFDAGDFYDIDENMVAQLEKEYDSENIIELVEDYFFHNKKILRIMYHPETPDIIDPKILHRMEEKRKDLDIDYEKARELYEKARRS